jgi:tetratricopeptide (TPR) repeat protein/23S rRNA U2552 (ribose-2'-O)-methylase RlmE/FtsJ
LEDVQLGPYRTIEKLGTGGMGTVYLAKVTEPVEGLDVGDRVAVKIIHANLMSTPGFFKRFLREGDIGRRIRHENVVITYDVDGTEVDGKTVLFIATELVEGQTLRDLLGELTTVPEDLCLHVALESAKALEAVHATNVIHRDLKPENVMITNDHVVKLMDLGVARLQEDGSKLSKTGTFVGSVFYAAPEQFTKKGDEIDGRADLYALGLLLYELATGSHPFAGRKLVRLMQAQLTEQPRPASELNAQISPFFQQVMNVLLEKDPEDRFASATELREILEHGEASAWWRDLSGGSAGAIKSVPRRIQIPRETSLHGRDDELAQMRSLFKEVEAGRGCVLLLEGEAGVGKTRLVDEVVASLRAEGESLFFLFGNYPPRAAATDLRGFATAFRDHFTEHGLKESLENYLGAVPPLIPATQALLLGKPPPEGEEPLTKESLQVVLLHASRAMARERPTILLIDDLQFAPAEGLGMFVALASAIVDERILLIGSTRSELADEWVDHVMRLDHAARLPLTRLGPRALNRLLVEAFRSEQLAEDLGWQVARKSDGNPLFVFEILDGLRESGLIKKQPDGVWVKTREIREIGMPSSIMDLIGGRLGDLEPDDKDLLDAAACCGFTFDPLLVTEALGLQRIPVLKKLARIEQQHRLIHAAGRLYVFDHNQVHEVVYERLSPLLREHYHAALARALEDRVGPDGEADGETAAQICDHCLRGDKGESVAPFLEKALAYLEANHRNEVALRLAEEALAVEGLLDGPVRVRVLLSRGSRLDLLGRRPEERESLDQALSLTDTDADPSLGARVRRRLGRHLLAVIRPDEALEQLRSALDLARSAGDLREEGATLVHLGAAMKDLGRTTEALEHYGLAIEILKETGDRNGEAMACARLGTLMHGGGRLDEALALGERALRLARETGNRLVEGIAVGNLGEQARDLGCFEEARRYHERQLAIFSETGYRRGEAGAIGGLGIVLTRMGRYAEARASQGRALAISREVGDVQEEAYALWQSAWLHAELGDVRRATEALAELDSLLLSGRASAVEGDAAMVRGRIAEQAGKTDDAAAQYRHALDRWQAQSYPGGLAAAHLALGRLLASSAESSEHLNRALELGRDLGAPDIIVLATMLGAREGAGAAAAEDAFEHHSGNLSPTVQLEARYLLWKMGAGPDHLDEADRLLDRLCDGAPEAYRDAMVSEIPLYRAVREAVGG